MEQSLGRELQRYCASKGAPARSRVYSLRGLEANLEAAFLSTGDTRLAPMEPFEAHLLEFLLKNVKRRNDLALDYLRPEKFLDQLCALTAAPLRLAPQKKMLLLLGVVNKYFLAKGDARFEQWFEHQEFKGGRVAKSLLKVGSVLSHNKIETEELLNLLMTNEGYSEQVKSWTDGFAPEHPSGGFYARHRAQLQKFIAKKLSIFRKVFQAADRSQGGGDFAMWFHKILKSLHVQRPQVQRLSVRETASIFEMLKDY